METNMEQTMAILALPLHLIILPGARIQVPLRDRPDIAALLAASYKSRSCTPVYIGCVPHVVKASGSRSDISRYGTIAQIVGIQGHAHSDQTLVLKGLNRFRIEKVLQQKPYTTALVTRLERTIDANMHRQLQQELQGLKHWNDNDALTYLAVAVAQRDRLEATHVIVKAVGRQGCEDGMLADALMTIITSTFADRLSVLTTIDPQKRLGKVIDIIECQIASLPSLDQAGSSITDEDLLSLLRRQCDSTLGNDVESGYEDIDLTTLGITWLLTGYTPTRDMSTRSKL